MKKALFEAHKLEKGFCMIYDVTQKRSAPYLNRGRFDFFADKALQLHASTVLEIMQNKENGNRLDHFTQEFT